LHVAHVGEGCPDGVTGTFHFVHNQVDRHDTTRGTISVVFTGSSVTHDADKVLRRVRHYTVQGVGSIVSASDDIAEGKLVLSDFSCNETPPPTPSSCDAAAPGDILVPINARLGDHDMYGSLLFSASVSVNIAAGSYDLWLGSSDWAHPQYDKHGNDVQFREQWKAVFGNGGVVGTSGYTPDLPNDEKFHLYSMGTITLSGQATTLEAVHWIVANGPTGTPESIEAACAILRPTSAGPSS